MKTFFTFTTTLGRFAAAPFLRKRGNDPKNKDRPEITAAEADLLVSRFDLAGWNAGGEEIQSDETKKANIV